MRHLPQTRLKFPPIGRSGEYVEPKRPGLSAQIFGGGAEKFVAEMMVVDVDQIVVDQHSSSPNHRLHYHQQPPEDPKSSIIADCEPRQVF
jgi:hypothetical protein